MSRSDELEAVLKALAEQSTALLAAYAESLRLQRVVLELLQERAAAPATAGEPAGPGTATNTGLDAAHPRTQAATAPAAADVVEPAAAEPTGAAVTTSGGTAERPPLRVVPSRRAVPAKEPAGPPLATLHRLSPAGDCGALVLNFGAHKGETLGEVARSDPEYVRRLATGAQRGEVRAAARRLLVLLGQGNRRPPAGGHCGRG
jgi:hypothetical protein